jgi:hypothetical protein
MRQEKDTHGETQTRIINTHVEVWLHKDLAAGKGKSHHHITMTLSPSLRQQGYWWCSLCLVVHSAWNIAAFQVDVPLAAGAFTRRRHLSSVCALPPILTDFLDTASSPSSILLAEEAIDRKAIIMEKVFRDSVHFFDFSGPLGPILIVTFAAFVLLALLSVLIPKIDGAMDLLVDEYEATLKKDFPQRWNIISAGLEGVPPEDRIVELLILINQMEEEDPEFEKNLKQKLMENVVERNKKMMEE